MKKLIPFIYVAMMYVTALSLGTLIHPGYLAYFLVVLLIMAVANMINAFRLNNEDNLKEMKTAMAVCTFGPIPFYLFVLYFFAAVASITNDINSAAMLAVATIVFSLWEVHSDLLCHVHVLLCEEKETADHPSGPALCHGGQCHSNDLAADPLSKQRRLKEKIV